MIDSHCHLDLEAFDNDLKTVLQRAIAYGVERFHIPGTTRDGWHKQRSIATQFAQVDYSFGLHPYFLTNRSLSYLTELQQLLEQDNNALALGEIGLDAHCDGDWHEQLVVFEQQLHIAKELSLPVIIHHRKTHHDILQVLKKVNFQYGGIIHAFSGSYEVAKQYIERNFVLGIGGTITYERANKTKQALTRLSLSDIVLETDSPDMPMQGKQGKRNEPTYLPIVVEHIHRCTGHSTKDIITATSNNYWRVLGRK